MSSLSKNDPKVIELSYDILEKVIVAIDFKTQEELLELVDIMVKKAQTGGYPELIKLAYEETKYKIEHLKLEQLNEIKKIINS
ncbi:MAG: hypothetical protein IJ837_04005 [Clostridia bacterium]|nr:hypothetical protein [Clostridia bacterium]